MESGVVIAGVYSSPSEWETPGPDDEFVVLVNTGDAAAELVGWSLTNLKQDKVHHFRYLFPRFLGNGDPWLMEPGGLLVIHTGRGRNSRTAGHGEPGQYHLFQHRTLRVWEDPVDIACLYNREGELVSSRQMPLAHRKA